MNFCLDLGLQSKLGLHHRFPFRSVFHCDLSLVVQIANIMVSQGHAVILNQITVMNEIVVFDEFLFEIEQLILARVVSRGLVRCGFLTHPK